jgi:hypothetical protein
MQRVNNTIRGREKNYRGLNTEDTPMLPLFVAYYNLFTAQSPRENTCSSSGTRP